MFNNTFDFSSPALESSAPDETLSNAAIARGLDRVAELISSTTLRERLRQAAASVRFAGASVAAQVQIDGVEGVHALGLDYELAGVVTDWVRSGRLSWLERLESRRRRALAEVPGIGPRLAQELEDVLGVRDVDGLARAAREGQLHRAWGFGPKRVQMIEALLLRRAT